jgi:hypothetical protein
MQTMSGRASSSPDPRRQGTVSHIRILLSNRVLHIEYVDLRMYNFAR